MLHFVTEDDLAETARTWPSDHRPVSEAEAREASAYLDGDWCWCVHPFSVTDTRLRDGDKSMSFVLSNYLDSGFAYVFFTSVVLTDPQIRAGILRGITARDW